jgi:hypothetical protein
LLTGDNINNTGSADFTKDNETEKGSSQDVVGLTFGGGGTIVTNSAREKAEAESFQLRTI